MLPDFPLTRKMASKTQIKMMRRYEMDAESVKKGEQSPEEKQRVTEIYMQRFPKKAEQLNRLIEEQIAKTPAYQTRDDLDSVRLDMRFCFFAYGFLPNEYVPYELEHKSRAEREGYISERLRIIFRCRMNDLLAADLFKDKVKTYKKYRKYFRRAAISVERESDLESYHAFIKDHPVFVKKVVFESQGHSVELIDLAKSEKDADTLFHEFIKVGKHILEEPIRQSDALSAFNASSVNTVRMVTLNTRNGIVFPYCCLRTGRPGHFVDNGGAGGIMVGVDQMTGLVNTNGLDEVGGVYETHPGSGTRFKGYQLPEWDALLALCRKAAEEVPAIKYIGWDLAHTPAGWVLVEGNECCQLIAKQMLDGKGLRAEFERIMKDMDLVTE